MLRAPLLLTWGALARCSLVNRGAGVGNGLAKDEYRRVSSHIVPIVDILTSMSRTIELGRAIIALQSANLELWLTTLITISPCAANNLPQQHSINIENLNSRALLDFLHSGYAWVGRSNLMQMSLDINLHGEPLDGSLLRELGEGVVNAPVSWRRI